MKHLLLTTIAAVVLVGCGESQQSAPTAEVKPVEPVAEAAKPTTPPKAVSANKGADPARGIKPEPPTAKAPALSIYLAAMTGDIKAVKQHLAVGTDVNTKDNFTGYTPLHRAASNGLKEIVELLLAKGADVNAKNDGGFTPLHYAASRRDKEIAELLIAKDADVNAKMEDGDTPLDWAIEINRTEIADFLRKHGGKTSEELKAEGK